MTGQTQTTEQLTTEKLKKALSPTGPSHDPREIARGFQQLICSSTKNIGFFAGAGTSVAVKVTRNGKSEPLIPDVMTLTDLIEESLEEKYKSSFQRIKQNLSKSTTNNVHIEHILSHIELNIQVVGDETLCGLKLEDFRSIKSHIETQIAQRVNPSDIPANLIHEQFAQWIQNTRRRTPVEVFTTNYDLLFEIGFERILVPCFDGFVGSYRPFFSAAEVEENKLPSNWVRLWKIHGSLGWQFDKERKRFIKDIEKHTESLVVYPSLLKYDDSRKQPYVSYLDRLSSFLRQNDSFLITSGYSFGDQHINEVILNALSRSSASNVYAFVFDELQEDHDVVKLAKNEPRLSIFGPNAAVIGRVLGEWRLNREPSKEDSIQIGTYFDEEGVPAREVTDPKYEQIDNIPHEERQWLGRGRFELVDFQKLINFMQIVVSES